MLTQNEFPLFNRNQWGSVAEYLTNFLVYQWPLKSSQTSSVDKVLITSDFFRKIYIVGYILFLEFNS